MVTDAPIERIGAFDSEPEAVSTQVDYPVLRPNLVRQPCRPGRHSRELSDNGMQFRSLEIA